MEIFLFGILINLIKKLRINNNKLKMQLMIAMMKIKITNF